MALSGQKTVTTAGTAEKLGDQVIAAPLMVKALAGNSGAVYIGNDGAGDVSSLNGMPLAAGEVVVFDHAANLGALWIDAALDGDGVAWLALAV